MFAFTLGYVTNRESAERTHSRPAKGRKLSRSVNVIVTVFIPKHAKTNEARPGIVDSRYALFRASVVIPIAIQLDKSTFYQNCTYAYHESITFELNTPAYSEFDPDINKVKASGIYYFKTIEPFNFTPNLNEYYIKTWYTNGQLLAEVHYKNGKKDGIQTIWSENGRMKCQSEYSDGLLNGYFRSYHQTGFRHLDLWFLNGKKQGLCRSWNSEGELVESATFDEDKLIDTTYHPDHSLYIGL
jgi:hypothetical protein